MAERESLRADVHQPCGCKQKCCDLPEEHDHPFAVCKGLPPRPTSPLVTIEVVSRG